MPRIAAIGRNSKQRAMGAGKLINSIGVSRDSILILQFGNYLLGFAVFHLNILSEVQCSECKILRLDRQAQRLLMALAVNLRVSLHLCG